METNTIQPTLNNFCDVRLFKQQLLNSRNKRIFLYYINESNKDNHLFVIWKSNQLDK